jgi:cysteine desulfurase
MLINNEIGSIQDFYGIGEIAKAHNILFHSDAVQTYGKYILNMEYMPFDMLSLSAHKINGFKGTGALYVRGGKIDSFIHGGGQESGLRGGTENVIGIVAMGKAAEIIDVEEIQRRYDEVNYLYKIIMDGLVRYTSDGFLSTIRNPSGYSGYVLNPYKNPYILSLVFPGLRGEQIARLLNENGICVSTGSACNAHSHEPSHVLKAIGLSEEEANSSIRVSLSHDNKQEEIRYFIKILVQVVTQLKGIKKEE